MVAAVPVSVVGSQPAQAAARDGREMVGGWSTTHTSLVGPFRELRLASAEGSPAETNTLLLTGSNPALHAQLTVTLPSAGSGSD